MKLLPSVFWMKSMTFSPLAAAETLEAFTPGVDVEAWRLFAVERAQALELLARTFEPDVLGDDLDDVGLLAELADRLFG